MNTTHMDIENMTSYVNMRIGTEYFAISVFKVLEIIKFECITKIPNSSPFVPGVINFRGSIVPVIDLHKRFGIEADTNSNNMIIVVELSGNEKKVLMGLLVDQVSDVIEFSYKNIRTMPELGIKYNPEFLEGFIEEGDQFVMVLNTDKVLNIKELAEVNTMFND